MYLSEFTGKYVLGEKGGGAGFIFWENVDVDNFHGWSNDSFSTYSVLLPAEHYKWNIHEAIFDRRY